MRGNPPSELSGSLSRAVTPGSLPVIALLRQISSQVAVLLLEHSNCSFHEAISTLSRGIRSLSCHGSAAGHKPPFRGRRLFHQHNQARKKEEQEAEQRKEEQKEKGKEQDGERNTSMKEKERKSKTRA
jgi:hypothetical protein